MVVPHSRSVTRILCPLLLVLLVAFLASCSGGETATTSTAGDGGIPTTPPSDSTDTSVPMPPGGVAPEGESTDSLPALEQAVQETPEDLEALGRLAVAYFQARSYAQAEETYKRMLALEDSAEIHNNLGNVYRDWNKTEQAIEQYEKAMDIDATLAVAYGNLAAVYMMSGQMEKAVEVAQEGIENTTGSGRQQLEALLDSLQ